MSVLRPTLDALEDRAVPATLTVNTAADDTTADGVLSLREAVALVRRRGDSTAALGRALTAGESGQISGGFPLFTGDTITFDPALTGQTITLAQGDPSALRPAGTGLAFVAPFGVSLDGAAAPGLTISGNHQRRILEVTAGSLAVQNLTMAEGLATDVPAPLTGAGGGAILNAGATLTVSGVTFVGNTASGGAGGGGANAGYGGAVLNLSGTLSIRNSTFTGNTAVGAANGYGGAIAVYGGTNSLFENTISGNTAAGGSGLFVMADVAAGTNQITAMSNNILGQADASVPDILLAVATVPGYILTGNNNLVRNDGTAGLPPSFRLSSADPLLAPLAFNGGPTRTLLPLPGSPVLNVGTNGAVGGGTDQRGLPRVVDGTVDLGSVEVQPSDLGPPSPSSPAILTPSSATFTVGQAGSFFVQATVGSELRELALLPDWLTFVRQDSRSGYIVGTPPPGSAGTGHLLFEARSIVWVGYRGNVAYQAFTLTIAPRPVVATGAGAGGGPHVIATDGIDGTVLRSFSAYDPSFTGGVRVAVADVTGDGTPDYVTGAGAGGGPHIKVFDGGNGAEVRNFYAYDPAFTGGVWVAAGDLTGDGFAEVIVGAGTGGGSRVTVWDGKSVALIRSFYAYDPAFAGGVTVAVGDVTGDGRLDLVTGTTGGGSNVRVFDGPTGDLVRSFYAYDPAFTGGAFVTAADLDGDGFAEIITGAGAGGAPHVKLFDGRTGAVAGSYLAFDPAFAGGVSVSARDTDGDGRAELLTGPGLGGGAQLRVWNRFGEWERDSLIYASDFLGGLWVG